MSGWVWAYRDVVQQLHDELSTQDTAALRSTSRDWRGVLDSTLTSLAPSMLHSKYIRASFPGLKSLDLSRLQLAPDAQLQHLTALSALTQLTLGGPGASRLREGWMEAIGALTGLRRLAMRADAKVRWASLRHLSRLTQLQTLALIGFGGQGSTDGSDLGQLLGTSPGLTKLVLGDSLGLSFLGDGALEGLGSLRPGQLIQLDLSGFIELTDAGLRHLRQQTGLTSLDLHNCMKLGAAAMKLVGSFISLTRLNLRGCAHLSDEQLLLLAGLRRLQWLSLQSCNSLTGSTLAPLVSKLPQLAHLNLAHCLQLPDSCLSALAALPAAAASLQHLDVSGCLAVTPDGLACLSKVTGLTQLGVAGLSCRREGSASMWTAAFHNDRAHGDTGRLGGSSAMGDASCSKASSDGSSGSSDSSSSSGGGGSDSNDSSDSSDSGSLSGSRQGATWTPLTNLRSLDLSGLRLAPAGAAAALLSRLPTGLQRLNLAGSYLCQPNAVVSAVGDRLLQLQSLDLFGATAARALCSEDLMPLAALTALTYLSLSGICCGSDSDEEGDHDTEHGEELHGMRRGSAHAASPTPAAAASAGGEAAGRGEAGDAAAARPPVRRVLAFEDRQDGPFSAADSDELHRKLEITSCAMADLPPTQAQVADIHVHAGNGSSGQEGMLPGPIEAVSHELRKLAGLGSTHTPGNNSQAATVSPHSGTCTNADVDMTEAPQMQQGLRLTVNAPAWLPALRHLQELCIRESPAVDDAWVAALSTAASLKLLDLSGCRAISGIGFSALSHLSALTNLKLQACSGLDDAGMVAGVACLTGLRRLNLRCCGGFGDKGLAAVGHCSRLVELSIAGNRNIGSRGLAGLRALSHLSKLDAAMCCAIEDYALGSLARLPRLREIDLRCCWKLTDAGITALLARSTALLSVNVEGCHRLSAACQPPGFGGGWGVTSPGASPVGEGLRRRPGVITRVPGLVAAGAGC